MNPHNQIVEVLKRARTIQETNSVLCVPTYGRETIDLAVQALLGCEAVQEALEDARDTAQQQHLNDVARIAVLEYQVVALTAKIRAQDDADEHRAWEEQEIAEFNASQLDGFPEASKPRPHRSHKKKSP